MPANFATAFEFNFAKKFNAQVNESRHVHFQNRGLKAVGKRLTWPLTSLMDSLISMSEFMNLLTV